MGPRDRPSINTNQNDNDFTTTDNSTNQQQPRRNRGYSLRRQVFNRNLNGTGEDANGQPPSPIELEQQQASSFGPHNLEIHEEPIFSDEEYNSKNKSKEIITTDNSNSNNTAADVLPNYSFWASKKLKQKNIREAFYKTKDFVLRKKKIPPSKNGRIIPIELTHDSPLLIDERTEKPYCSNLIRSSIYTPYNFLPRQLVAQFSKLANL